VIGILIESVYTDWPPSQRRNARMNFGGRLTVFKNRVGSLVGDVVGLCAQAFCCLSEVWNQIVLLIEVKPVDRGSTATLRGEKNVHSRVRVRISTIGARPGRGVGKTVFGL
jgi:hypothetical protein